MGYGSIDNLRFFPLQVVSSLNVLEPVRRAPLGIPFLYQKVRASNIYSGDGWEDH